MASYFRSLFGGGNSSNRSSSKPAIPSKLSKSHGHSRSTGTASPGPSVIYATLPGTASSAGSASSRTKLGRANSYTTTPTMKPSPLRYDSRRSFDNARPDTATSSRSSPIYRTASRTPHDAGRYPHFSSSGYATSSSSRSNSSSSIYPGSLHAGHRQHSYTHSISSPLVPSSHASAKTAHGDRRPQLKQNHTWHAGVESVGSSASLPARSRTRETPLCMHPLLAYTRRHPAPISYDVAFSPSARSVLDKTVHAPVPAVTLAQPATEPPIPASSRLVLRSDKFPWLVVVGPVGSTPTFYLGSKSRPPTSSAALTNLDVLYAMHTTLMTRVTPEEWASLGNGSRAQRKVAAAYEKRCTRMGGGWEGGVRRVDWLHSKTHFVGIEMDKTSAASGKVGKLIFGRG